MGDRSTVMEEAILAVKNPSMLIHALARGGSACRASGSHNFIMVLYLERIPTTKSFITCLHLQIKY